MKYYCELLAAGGFFYLACHLCWWAWRVWVSHEIVAVALVRP